MNEFKAISPPQRRILMAIEDLGEPFWKDALERARRIYFAGAGVAYRSIEILEELGLVEPVGERPQPHQAPVLVKRRLTKAGKAMIPHARSWFEENA